ncbi:ABC transporter ATP-binding protein [Candidatus Roizmanbacteria bacterium]|nr:ABC transporter ATP-binding protein [Candidatus Roizmanbacteria bacterium]
MKPIIRFYHAVFWHPLSFWVGTGCIAVSYILSNLQPLFIKWLTESVQSQQLEQTIPLLCWFGIILVVGNIISMIGFYVSDIGMVTSSTDLMKKIVTHIHDLDFAYHTEKSSGKLISLLKRGDEAYFTYYDGLNRQMLNVIIGFLVMMLAFTNLRPAYILLSLGLLIVTILCSIYLIKINIIKRIAFSKVDDDLSAAKVDNLMNFDTVKYFAKEEFEQKRITHIAKRWNDALNAYFFTFRYFDIVVGNVVNVLILGLIGMGIYDLFHNAITLADFLLIITFAITLSPRLMNLLFILRELAKRHYDLEEYFNLLDEKIGVKDPVSPLTIENPVGKIEFAHVTFAYGKKHEPVLTDFSLSIAPGESVAFVGYSGAGKTTVTKLLMRMYDPKAGTITIDGIRLQDMEKSYLRTLIGIVPQDPLMFNNTVYYNIAYANPEASREEVVRAAKAAKVDEFVHHLPQQYETMVGERGIKLSGGQRQRLAIARVMLEKPPIVIFDEATSALDSASERDIQEAFWSTVKNQEHPRTSIIIAHRLSTIMRADRIVVMEKGRIVEIGSHKQLLKNENGIYHRLWSLQKDGFIADEEKARSPE